MTTNTTTPLFEKTVILRSGDSHEDARLESTLESVRALTFGQLMNFAASMTEHYRSDFYHDAISLRNGYTPETSVNKESYTFWYFVRDTGTNFTDDWDFAQELLKAGAGKCRIYSIRKITTEYSTKFVLDSAPFPPKG